jgi:hypothetical protein
MTTTPGEPVSDQDIETGSSETPAADTTGTQDADGTDGADADGTDGGDADGTCRLYTTPSPRYT